LGGAPFNVAWHLTGLGLRPLMVTAVGSDGPGREALDRMARWGMSTRGVQLDAWHPTGRVMATVVDGEPKFEIGSEQAYDYIDAASAVTALAQAPVSLVYHGTLALRSDRSWDAVKDLLQATGAPVFVDLNLREPWWTSHRLRWCLETATWVKLNEKELATVTGEPCGDRDACIQGALGMATAHGVKGVMVTRGGWGALAVVDGSVFEARAAPVDPLELVDTVGAGDGFSAVACTGILEAWSVEDMLRRGNDFASDLCRIRGATTEDPSLYKRHRERWLHSSNRPLEA